jgi:peptidoglycan/LPS O-acetylase OafA/YrhL
MPRSKNYIPTLDGWRAVSIFGVILFHLPTISFGNWSLKILQDKGVLGVQVFFVISGLLICTRLLQEEEQFGHMSLSGFYKRRLFRIQPASLFYLICLLILAQLRIIPLVMHAWWSALFAWRNYYPRALWEIPGVVYTNHFWSLAVEEHFYLIVPAIVAFVPRRLRLRSLGYLYLLSFIWGRIATHKHYTDNRTDVSFELLMLPSLLAVILFEKKEIRAKLTSPIIAGSIGFIVAMLFVSFKYFHGAASGLLIQFFIICCVFGSSLFPTSVPSQILEIAPLRYVGRISYSLYLWQQLFCINLATAGTGPVFSKIQSFPINILIALCCALSSYYLIERPFVRLGHRLAPSPPAAGRELDNDVHVTRA